MKRVSSFVLLIVITALIVILSVMLINTIIDMSEVMQRSVNIP